MKGEGLVLELVRQAAAGDAAAMECFLLSYDAQLLQYVNRHLPDDIRRTVDPQDIIQDIHFEAFRKLREFAAPDLRSALRWLLSMTRNRLIDVIRMHRAAKRGAGRDLDFGAIDGNDRSMVILLQDLAVYERTPSRSAVAHELVRTLERSIDQLPEDYRHAIRLRYIEGLSVEDAARRMGKTEGSIRMLCSRGMKLLRADLRSMSLYL